MKPSNQKLAKIVGKQINKQAREAAYIEKVEKAKREIDDITNELGGVNSPLNSLREQLFEIRKVLNKNGCSSNKLEKALNNLEEIDDIVVELTGFDSDIKYQQTKWDTKRPFGK